MKSTFGSKVRRLIRSFRSFGDVASLRADVAALSEKLELSLHRQTENRDAIIHQVNYTNHNLYLHLAEAMRIRDLHYRDVTLILDRIAHWRPAADVMLLTEHPIAIDTDDHKIPWGTAQDNTRRPRFVSACERRFERPMTFLDLGCSGGGLVLDFILRGHRAYGIEGSDYSQRVLRAEWRTLANNLFTGDITKPFTHRETQINAPIQCDVVSAWEVMEHIANSDLPQLFDNLHKHMKTDGIFVGSIALNADDHPGTGAAYHRTVKPKDWWASRFKELGMTMIDDHEFGFYDFARGTKSGPIDEDYSEHPEIGFHFVAIRN
jgi:SAM-dependent methyltransferase